MKFALSVPDRGALVGVVQASEGKDWDFARYGLIQAISKKVDYTQDERALLDFRNLFQCENCDKTEERDPVECCGKWMKRVGKKWNPHPALEIDFTNEEFAYIVEELKRLEEKKQLNRFTGRLFTLFVKGQETGDDNG